jgi:3-hydroxy acid dehydrogenase/malonic semialdehyde reductase
MNRIKGKLIVITGASSGIGRACAEQCASCGANLVLTARRIERLQELKSRLEQEHPVSVDIHKLDVRERADVRSFADNLKKSSRFPDVLINNAGLASGFALIQEGDFEDWDRMIDTNIKGLLNVSRTLIPLMVEKGSGHVVNVGSIAGYQVYPPGKRLQRHQVRGQGPDRGDEPRPGRHENPGVVSKPRRGPHRILTGPLSRRQGEGGAGISGI